MQASSAPPVTSRNGSIGGGGNVYAPPESDVEGTFIVSGLKSDLATGDPIYVKATAVGIQHGFRSLSGARMDDSYRIYQVMER